MSKESQSQSQKPYEDKVKESVYLLKQIRDLGVKPDHPGYADLKKRLDEWIKDGYSWQGKIDFTLQQKRAEVLLPNLAKATANIHLKHHLFE